MDFETLLGQLEASRPDLSDSLSLIRQYNKQKKETVDDTDDDNEEREKLLAILEKQRNINKSLLRRYQQLENNFELLVEHLDQMAEATGACPQCWGEDLACSRCSGRGKPGYYQPNEQYFDLYIKPVIVKLKKTIHS